MSPPELTIRPETPDDFKEIRNVVAAAFESDVEADLVEAIRASDFYEPDMALVAAAGSKIVGHVMISWATLRSGTVERPVLTLAPLAVAPDHQGMGIGSALVRAVCRVAEDRGSPMVLVEGGPRYYSRFGFEPAYRYGMEFPLPDWAPREAGQVLPLPGFEDDIAGVVVYPPAFSAAEG